ncbi:hypothetical protein J7M07_03500, partial [bacterium]|nr:hypothetical protein [bacterium]
EVATDRQISQKRSYILREGQTRLDLGVSFIISGTESIAIDDRKLVNGKDYRINTLRGTIVLVEPGVAGQVFEINYSRYPFPFSPVFARRFPSGGKPKPDYNVSVLASGRGSERTRRNPYRFNVSGSKSVGFSVGSKRGLGIDQSMNVTLSGKLAKDLEVKAFLSDDNLPVQTEGNTEELKRLDRISVSIKSKHAEVSLADFTMGMDWSEFSTFSRDLRGGEIKIDVRGQKLVAGGGIAKGRFETMEIRGKEGIQGPYELLPARRFNGVIIIPGSESVYLDGSRMKRGSENDYLIDYVRGSVIFTERVPVSDDSEIVIEFQVGERNYERTTISAGWSSSLFSDAVRLRGFFFRETDDRESPIGGEFTEEELDSLKNAGDNSDHAFASGKEEIDSGGNGYIFVKADSSAPSHYLFVESGARYLLDFYEVAHFEGDYNTDGFSTIGELKYKYVGAGSGDYRIGRPLALPEAKNVAAVSADANSDHLFFKGEGDVSNYDKNTMSDIGDEDNNGFAFDFEGGIKGVNILSSRLMISGEYSSLDERFRAPDRVREAYFYRNWNLQDKRLSGREEISGLNLRLEKEGLWEIEGNYKNLNRTDGLSANMAKSSACIGNINESGLRLEWFKTETGDDRKRDFALAEGTLVLWKFVPGILLDTERYSSISPAEPDTGRYYYRNILSLASKNMGNFSGKLSFTHRVTDNLRDSKGGWFRVRENDEVRLSGSYSERTRMIDLFISHRNKHDIEYGTTSVNDLARVRYRDSWRSLGLTTDMGYRIQSGEERRRQRAVIYVGENEGDYDQEGREVGQKRGDYMAVYIPGGEKEGVRSVELTWRLSFGKGIRGIGIGKKSSSGWLGVFKRNVSMDNFFSVTEKSRTDQLLRLYTLDPSLLQRDDLTLFGRNKLRQEWNFLKDVKKYNLRFVISREDEEDNRTEGVLASRFLREFRLRAEAVPNSSFNISWEAARGLKCSRSGNSAAQNYRVESFSFSNTLGYRYGSNSRISLEFAYEKRDDELSMSGQRSFSARPAMNMSVGMNINISAFLKMTYTDIEEDNGQPLFFMENGMRQDWNLNGRYSFGKNITLGINYTGRREKDYRDEVKIVHVFKVESRASF